MLHLQRALAVGLLTILAASPAAGEDLAEGNWTLSYYPSGLTRTTYFLFVVREKDGKTVAERFVVPPGLPNGWLTLKAFSVEGMRVRVVLGVEGHEAVFEGTVEGKGKVMGSLALGRSLFPAEMTATNQTGLIVMERLDVPALRKANGLTLRPALLRARAAQSEEEKEKAKLLGEAGQAEKKAREEVPKLYEEVLAKHPGTTAAITTATALLRGAAERGASAGQAADWAAKGVKAAAPFGARFVRHTHVRMAEALLGQKGMGATALAQAQAARKLLPEGASTRARVEVLQVLYPALAQAGQDREAAAAKADLGKYEAVLDREYLANMPPFKAAKFAGRKGTSRRAVVVELFTGAHSQQSVAADMAFDALRKAYEPSELVLLRYHLNTLQTDPLSNPASLARWEYYKKAFPADAQNVPRALFNGKPQGKGGGGPDWARFQAREFRKAIDPLLEEEPGAVLAVRARRAGDTIQITATVSGLKEPGEGKRLRLVLAEETVRYAGGNGLRFHHQVVRDLPGGVEGFALKEETGEYSAKVELKVLRERLKEYLGGPAREGDLPGLDRPLALEDLRVIAFVQDDKTREIVQGVQVTIEE